MTFRVKLLATNAKASAFSAAGRVHNGWETDRACDHGGGSAESRPSPSDFGRNRSESQSVRRAGGWRD